MYNNYYIVYRNVQLLTEYGNLQRLHTHIPRFPNVWYLVCKWFYFNVLKHVYIVRTIKKNMYYNLLNKWNFTVQLIHKYKRA